VAGAVPRLVSGPADIVRLSSHIKDFVELIIGALSSSTGLFRSVLWNSFRSLTADLIRH